MKKVVKALCLILAIVLAVSSISACAKKPAEKTVLRIGMECAFPPHNWTQLASSDTAVAMPDGTFVDGYDIQIAKLIAAGIGADLEVVKVDWDGLPPSLTSNKIDLIIAGMTDTEERRETIDFTDVYWSSDLVIVVKKDGAYAGATSLADFSGAKITAQLGTLHYDLIDLIPGASKQQAMEDFPTMLIALSSGKIDGYVAERPAAISAQISNPDVTFIAFEADKGFGEEMTVSIGLRKNEADLKAKINKVLAGITVAQRQEMMEAAVARQPLND
jgi:ABC-type amino acid transport substrate-binding protein